MIWLDPRAPFIFGVVMIGLLAVYLLMFHAMPGSLAGPHAEVIIGSGLDTCEQCHVNHELTPGCLACHKEIDHQIKTDKGYHAFLMHEGEPLCAPCHREHSGSDFPLVSTLSWKGRDPQAFRHEYVSFTLTGAHDSLTCDECHHDKEDSFTLPDFPTHPRVSTYLGLTQNCIDCHEDVHAGGLASDCLSCHNQQKWQPAPKFHHDEYFVLEGPHAHAACSDCHLIAATEDPNALVKKDVRLAFDHVKGKACVDCHDSPHRVQLAETCTACHLAADQTWAAGTRGVTPEVHAATGFILNAAHTDVACEKCHRPDAPFAQRYPDPGAPNYFRQANHCEGCHTDPHNGQFQGRYPTCLECHEETRFKPSHYDVARHTSVYPLIGAHAKAQCNDCHREQQKEATTVSATMIRIYTGTSTACNTCHRDEHRGQFRQEGTTRCERCHDSTSEWSADRFDHNRDSRFQLDGAHDDLSCQSCHPSVRQPDGQFITQYLPIGTRCEDCHGFVPQQ